MKIQRILAGLAVLVGMIGLPLATASSASAATADCYYYQVCLYYNSSSYGFGAVYKQSANVSDYAGHYFSCGNNGCSGAGYVVKNAAAALDSWYNYRFRVYYNSNYSCAVACQTFAAYATFKNFNSTLHDQNASGKFLSS